MGAAKIWGWILVILGALLALITWMRPRLVKFPVFRWGIIAVLVIVGIILLMKKK